MLLFIMGFLYPVTIYKQFLDTCMWTCWESKTVLASLWQLRLEKRPRSKTVTSDFTQWPQNRWCAVIIVKMSRLTQMARKRDEHWFDLYLPYHLPEGNPQLVEDQYQCSLQAVGWKKLTEMNLKSIFKWDIWCRTPMWFKQKLEGRLNDTDVQSFHLSLNVPCSKWM